MRPTDKPKVSIRVYQQFPERPVAGLVHQFTLEQVKKYASSKPLRRPSPRPKRH
jgi:hypothetical protein